MTSSDGDVDRYNDHSDEENAARASAAEAGITRGALRSLGRSAVRLPAVGRLPITRRGGAPALRTRLQVKQVARVSDRVSTGLDLLNTAQEANLSRKRARFQRLVTSEWTTDSVRPKRWAGMVLLCHSHICAPMTQS